MRSHRPARSLLACRRRPSPDASGNCRCLRDAISRFRWLLRRRGTPCVDRTLWRIGRRGTHSRWPGRPRWMGCVSPAPTSPAAARLPGATFATLLVDLRPDDDYRATVAVLAGGRVEIDERRFV